MGLEPPGAAQAPQLEVEAGSSHGPGVSPVPREPRQNHLQPSGHSARQTAAAALGLHQHKREFVGVFDGEGNLPYPAAVGAAGLVPRTPSAAGSRQDQLLLRSSAVLQKSP